VCSDKHPTERKHGVRTGRDFDLFDSCDVFHKRVILTPNDSSSATRPTRAFDCNLDAMAGFAAAHG
jgi:hypothetical protein